MVTKVRASNACSSFLQPSLVRLIMNNGLSMGTQIDYIQRARASGYAVIVTNTNLNINDSFSSSFSSGAPIRVSMSRLIVTLDQLIANLVRWQSTRHFFRGGNRISRRRTLSKRRGINVRITTQERKADIGLWSVDPFPYEKKNINNTVRLVWEEDPYSSTHKILNRFIDMLFLCLSTLSGE